MRTRPNSLHRRLPGACRRGTGFQRGGGCAGDQPRPAESAAVWDREGLRENERPQRISTSVTIFRTDRQLCSDRRAQED